MQERGRLPTSNEAQLPTLHIDWARVRDLPQADDDELTNKLATLLAFQCVDGSFVFEALNTPERRSTIVPYLARRRNFAGIMLTKASQLIDLQARRAAPPPSLGRHVWHPPCMHETTPPRPS